MTEEKTHRGWEGGGLQGLSPPPRGLNCDVLHAMGHRKAELDGQFTLAKGKPDNRDLSQACFAPFRRNLTGYPGHESQFGLPYVEFHHFYPAEVHEQLGTAKAKALLQSVMVSELDKLARTHPVAVWRQWPEMDQMDGALKCYMRLHVMTEAQYQVFAQSE